MQIAILRTSVSEDAPWAEFMCLAFTRKPGGATVGTQDFVVTFLVCRALLFSFVVDFTYKLTSSRPQVPADILTDRPADRRI